MSLFGRIRMGNKVMKIIERGYRPIGDVDRNNPPGSEPNSCLVSNKQLNTMLICSIRYAMGRKSYIVDDVGELLMKFSERLTKDQLRIFRRDIAIEIERSEESGKWNGHRCDHSYWRRLVDRLDSEIDKI